MQNEKIYWGLFTDGASSSSCNNPVIIIWSRSVLDEECLATKSLINLDDARVQIDNFINYYNTKRLHSSLFYLTPDDFLNDRITEKLEARITKLKLAKKARCEVKNVC